MRLVNLFWSVLIGGILCSMVVAQLPDPEANPVGASYSGIAASSKTKVDLNGSKAFAGADFTEYLYGVGNYNAFLVKIDHFNNTVSSADLFPSEFGSYFGAAGSGMPDFFWATSSGNTEYGSGSALYKVYPAEKTIVPIGNGYGQDPRYPGNPNYVINIRELAYNDDTGILYGTDYLGLYEIDTATGTASHIGDFGNGIDGETIDYVFSMEYDSLSMNMYMTNQKTLPNGARLETHLYTVDMATAVPAFVGDTGTSGLTDIYQSHLSDQMIASANLDTRILQVDPLTGLATLRGNIADNILGLSGEFLEVPGPQVWFQGAGGRPQVTVYSELNGVRVTDSASTGNGWDRNCSAQAFCQEAGQSEGIGQHTDIYSRINFNHDLSTSYFDIDVDFSSEYNGGGMYGTGGATVDITWHGTMFILPDDTYPHGTRVLVLVDGSQLINDQVSSQVVDFEMCIYDSYIDRPVVLLTEEDIPNVDSTPFLGAFYANVGKSSGYADTYQVEMKLTVNIDLPAGDMNADGIVNLYDFETVAGNWLMQGCSEIDLWCSGGDVNQDSSVGLDDLADFAASWLQGKGWDASNSYNMDMGVVFHSIAIPETPTTLNDECADAVQIVADTEYFGTTRTATGVDITSCNTDDNYDVWYKFTPQEDGLYKVYVRTAGPEAINPCVALYDSCGGNQLECWDQFDDNRFFTANAWTDYYLRIADNDDSRGDFKMAVIYYPRPDNDDCENAVPVSFYEYISGDTFGATNDSSSSCGNGDTADVWYSITADDDGNIGVKLEPFDEFTSFNVSVFDDCNPENRQELACTNTIYTGMDWPSAKLGFSVVQGETYLIRIAATGGYGEFDFHVEPGPDNDKCSDAIEVYMWDSQYSSTFGASGEDITSCGFDDKYDVWYKYTADYDHMVMFQAYDDSYLGVPITVSLFDDCDNGNEQICAESTGDIEYGSSAMAIYSIASGETVYIRVSFSESNMGDFQLNVDEIYPPDNDECENAEYMEGWAEGSTIGASGSDETTCGENDSYDVWYQYIPETSGLYIIYVDSYEMPILGTVAIFDGECDTLNQLECSEMDGYGELYIDLVEGQNYYIRVGSYEGSQTHFGLNAFSNYDN